MVKTDWNTVKFEKSDVKLNLNDMFKHCTIIKIYKGKDNYCRCGCGGDYNYDKDTFEKEIAKANRFFRKNIALCEMSNRNIDNYLNIPTSVRDKVGKAITIYFNGKPNI